LSLRQIVALGSPLLRGAQALEEILESLHPTRDPPAGEASHGVLEIATRQELVGHRSEKLVGLERV